MVQLVRDLSFDSLLPATLAKGCVVECVELQPTVVCCCCWVAVNFNNVSSRGNRWQVTQVSDLVSKCAGQLATAVVVNADLEVCPIVFRDIDNVLLNNCGEACLAVDVTLQ